MRIQHENTQPIKTRTPCNTTHTHTWTRERAAERTRAARSHNETEHGARVSEPRHETETQDMSAGIRTPRSNTKQGMQTRERAAERTRAARSHNETEHGARVSEPRHETETQDMSAGIRTPRSNTKQGTQTRERAAERTRAARSHNETEHGARVSEPRHETETQDMSAGIRTPRSNTKQGMQTRERAARVHSHKIRT